MFTFYCLLFSAYFFITSFCYIFFVHNFPHSANVYRVLFIADLLLFIVHSFIYIVYFFLFFLHFTIYCVVFSALIFMYGKCACCVPFPVYWYYLLVTISCFLHRLIDWLQKYKDISCA